MTGSPTERLLTVKEVADLLNVPVSWAYAKAEAGELPHLKLGRYLRFRLSEIEGYLTCQHRGPEVK